MRVPLADLPIRCFRTIRQWRCLNQFSSRFLPASSFLRFLGFLRLLVLLMDCDQPHRPLLKLKYKLNGNSPPATPIPA